MYARLSEQVQAYIDQVNEQMPKCWGIPATRYAALVKQHAILNWKIETWNQELRRLLAKKTPLRGKDKVLAATLPKKLKEFRTERTKIVHMISLERKRINESEITE